MSSPADLEKQHTLATAVARLDALRVREVLAGWSAEAGEAGSGTPALSREESLELLALGEVVARKAAYGRQLTVRAARAAGASWSQIGAALGTTKEAARESHTQWLQASGEE